MPKSISTPALLESISTKSVKAKMAANALTERIEQFATLLAQLPGRIETSFYGRWPDAQSAEDAAFLSLGLWFHREGREWVLSWAKVDDRASYDPENTIGWRPLNDAPLKIKLAAVGMFPDLLGAMEESQDKLIKELEDATNIYDEMVKSVVDRVKAKGSK